MNARLPTAAMAAAAWALFAALSLWLTLKSGISLDTDGAMRLAQLRDLLAGQSWFDTAQHRMNTPYGLAMHWSRLADSGPALILMVLRPLGARLAESVMLYVWPLAVFFTVLAALARIAAHLAGRAAAVLVLPLALLCVETYGMFTPGGIDHHNLQIALVLWGLVFLIEKRAAALAAVLALSLGVGLETMPYVLVAILLGCLWLADDSDRAFKFGAALAGMAGLLWFATTAGAYRFTPACDTYSLFYAGLLVAGGGGLAGLAMLARWRALGFVLLVLGVLALGFGLNRACFLGPYAGVGVHLKEIFLSRINEARPAFDFMSFAPSEFVAGYVYGAFALIASLFLAQSRAVLLVVLFAAVALGIATFEIREASFAILFALPGLAAALATYVLPRGAIAAALAVLIASDATFALAGSQIEGDARQAARIQAYEAQIACGQARAMVPLAVLPQGAVAAFVDQGPGILIYTRDAVIAGPYHRDAAGIEDSYAIFTGAPAAARAILQRRKIAYLMACRAAPDWTYYISKAPDGLLARLARGTNPPWLSPAGRAGDVLVWKVDQP